MRVGILTSNIAKPLSPVVTKEVLLVTPRLSLSEIANLTCLLAIPPLSAFRTCTAICTTELSFACCIVAPLVSFNLISILSATVELSVEELLLLLLLELLLLELLLPP